MLPPGAGGMFISSHPLSQQVTIPGVDLAYFMDGSSDRKSVGYQVAGLSNSYRAMTSPRGRTSLSPRLLSCKRSMSKEIR